MHYEILEEKKKNQFRIRDYHLMHVLSGLSK